MPYTLYFIIGRQFSLSRSRLKWVNFVRRLDKLEHDNTILKNKVRKMKEMLRDKEDQLVRDHCIRKNVCQMSKYMVTYILVENYVFNYFKILTITVGWFDSLKK